MSEEKPKPVATEVAASQSTAGQSTSGAGPGDNAAKKALEKVHVQGLVERINKLLTDVEVMVDYVAETGKTLSAELVHGLAELDCDRKDLCAKDFDSDKCEGKYENLVRVHNLLVNAVAPATPTSLRSTERMWGFLTKNWAVNLIFGLTVISLILLIISYTKMAIRDPSQTEPVRLYLLMVWAAMLGAGLYSLNQARSYILDRTYNPQYDLAYYIRYFIGVTSGVILAFFGEKLMSASGAGSKAAVYGIKIEEMGPVVLALVGGFAADAVLQILQRIGDTLRTMVRGTEKDVAEKMGKAAHAEAAAAAARTKNEVMIKLQELSADLDEVARQKVNEFLKNMAK